MRGRSRQSSRESHQESLTPISVFADLALYDRDCLVDLRLPALLCRHSETLTSELVRALVDTPLLEERRMECSSDLRADRDRTVEI